MKLGLTASFHNFADNKLGCERIAADVLKRRSDSTPTANLGRGALDRVCLD